MSAGYGPARAVVEQVEELSPCFRRITFGGAELAKLGAAGPVYDQRIKLIFPPASGRLPELPPTENWYQHWLELPEQQRGVMRTYSIRELVQCDTSTTISVDFVLHPEPGGPASTWAAQATRGQQLLLVGPHRGAAPLGIEFNPGAADQITLLGDETAAPAIARTLEDLHHLGSTISGTAYIEVPTAEDVLCITGPPTVAVHWLPRAGAAHGSRLATSLGAHLCPEQGEETELVWGSPTPAAGTYYWIAGESGVVKQLRRFLVQENGVSREQVAFMGYWRSGVAMRG